MRERFDRPPRVLVFDSGLGGLTVHAEIVKARPDVDIAYVADDARFPYGDLREDELIARVERIIGACVAASAPDVVVIACNTASTLVLPPLRERHPNLPFVGTVPAIKPAAERSRSRLISVLATPGTVARDYTRALVRNFADDCEVELVGSGKLAEIAERRLRGERVESEEIAREIAPCFVAREGLRTDQIVLACTHFPLLLDLFETLAPWPVEFVDPAPAIARRVDWLLGPACRPIRDGTPHRAIFTSARPPAPDLQKALLRLGLEVSSVAPRLIEA